MGSSQAASCCCCTTRDNATLPTAVSQDPYQPGSPSEALEPVPVSNADFPAGEEGSVEYQRYFITIDKRNGGKHGLAVLCDEAGSLIVTQINDGLFSAWNQDHPQKKVHIGDRIVGINGLRGDVVDLVNECQRDKELVIELTRAVC
mmetsp:Transcript_51617/g.95547  ORF Transcript_51617/g.95547 Transcript_51617/m.95547 type:complete len:146 (+) Transcript_51617:108-545(+)